MNPDETGSYSNWALPSGRCVAWRVAGGDCHCDPATRPSGDGANDLPALTDPLVSDVLRALTSAPIKCCN